MLNIILQCKGQTPQQRLIHPNVVNPTDEKCWDFAEFTGHVISLLLCLYY